MKQLRRESAQRISYYPELRVLISPSSLNTKLHLRLNSNERFWKSIFTLRQPLSHACLLGKVERNARAPNWTCWMCRCVKGKKALRWLCLSFNYGRVHVGVQLQRQLDSCGVWGWNCPPGLPVGDPIGPHGDAGGGRGGWKRAGHRGFHGGQNTEKSEQLLLP